MSTPTPRKLGGSLVHPIGFGAMGISAYYGTTEPDEERLKVLDAVHASGATLWDTADVYGDSEELIGKWFARSGRRGDICLATKCGITGTSTDGVDGSPEYVRAAVERSLKRLGVEYIDLFYLHRPDPKTPIELTVRTIAEFVKTGKVRNIGLSECSAATLKRAHAEHPIAAVQVEYSPFTLDIEFPEINLMKTARELGVAIIAYSPLGRGLLTGQYKSPDDFEPDDFRRKIPRYSAANFPNILKLADGLKQIGASKQVNGKPATAGQVALAWLLAQGNDVIPIPGTRKVKYLEENMAAAALTLTTEEVAAVRAMAEKNEESQKGSARYPPGMMEALFAETPELKE